MSMSQTDTFEWLRERSNRLAQLEQAIIAANEHSHRDVPGWNQIIPMDYYKAICDLVESAGTPASGAVTTKEGT